ncbi:hypothetical protein DERP_014479 [Dermatophagoides pteronyssinus]|uniref:Envelope fusion protein n=1 Tax=Dermatophagoides pteronyssinus TaxID=6956 RepID=A0ABQ8IUG3_DERPT|nr:hypothetical protein DERP_014479 [Dermatophagoides pteronyssinus]
MSQYSDEDILYQWNKKQLTKSTVPSIVLMNCKIYAAREPSDSLLRLNINAIQIDKRYEILRADPFHLIVNDKLNSSNLCISVYTGPSYSVMDKDTKCVKSIMFNPFDDLQAPFIFHSMKCNNDLQKFGAKWRTMDCKPKEEMTSEEIVQVKTDENFVYYYCFLHNITLQQNLYPCKNQIYKTKLGQNLTINNPTIKFHKIKINLIHNLHDEFNELINFRIFNNFNSSVNLQDLTTLVEQEDKLIDKIVVSYFSQYYVYIIITILTIIILITTMLFTYYRIRARSYQRVAREQYQLAHLPDQIVSNGFNANDWLNGLFKCVNCPAIDFPTKCRYVDPLKLIIEILDQPPSNNQQINRLNLVNNINNRKPILDVTLQDESNARRRKYKNIQINYLISFILSSSIRLEWNYSQILIQTSQMQLIARNISIQDDVGIALNHLEKMIEQEDQLKWLKSLLRISDII